MAEKRTPLIKPPPIKTDAEKDVLRNKMKDKVNIRRKKMSKFLVSALSAT